MIKRLFSIVALCVFSFLLVFLGCGPVTADDMGTGGPVNMYFFYGQGCPHCAKERAYLDVLVDKYDGSVVLNAYEVYYDKDGQDAFTQTVDFLDIEVGGVPFLVVGEKYFVGYTDDTSTGWEIYTEVTRCIEGGCSDSLWGVLLGETEIQEEDGSNDADCEDSEENPALSAVSSEDGISPMYLDTPVLGKVDLKSISLPLATTLIAIVDGFNPCAMWVLIFLITLLINMQDRKKLYLLGSAFILASGVVYFIFLAAWFNFFKFIGFVYWIKVVIGIVAVVSGIMHVRSALFSKGGCHATSEAQRESIMDRIRKAVSEKSVALSLLGIVILAFSVNLVEVVCSAGLPAVYTNLLSSIELSPFAYYGYLVLYVVIFMLDDLFVFFVAMKTFEVTGIAKKYTKWSGLVGGVIIFIIGVILIVKPELLMFG